MSLFNSTIGCVDSRRINASSRKFIVLTVQLSLRIKSESKGVILSLLNPSNIGTSGAYFLYKDLVICQVGPTKEADELGVVRFGGHREEGETAWET
ncbi:hypothetical protein [Bacillus sp. T33-2]|uniref:hypothetical protein n=1 Tax=Bacillus sp. T33-2 TaxID=2054168 RepID=UPI001156CAB5